MADEDTKTTTRDDVKAMLDRGIAVKEIAETLNKTPATIYVHKRNIESDAGEAPRKRGRPPKLNKDGEAQTTQSEATSTTDEPKAATTSKPAATKAKANGNGHVDTRFPSVREAIVQELADKRSEVTVLERMLETV